jgi:ABC-type methionine transport system ATPase subunit
VLELVDLLDQAKKFPAQLSGGQQQRVSIARSVARQPKILIADEPTANLDKLTTAEIIALLKKINDFETTVLVSTHDESVVNTLQKRVITLKNGRVVNDQKANGIYKLDATPVEKTPLRQMQVPGHALRQKPIVLTTTEVASQGPVQQMTARSTGKSTVNTTKPVVMRQNAVKASRPIIARTPKVKRRVI